MKKIIITGATSMLGTALTEVSVRENTEVFAIVRPDTKRKDRIVSSPLVHVVHGTLEKLGDIEELPKDCDTLYHFAWAGTERTKRDEPEVHELNIKYTLDAVKLAKKTGCHRFVGAGSQAEYGPVYEKIDENTRFAPTISYGIAKYTAGILSRKLCEKTNIEHVWGRVFSVYGPNDNEGTMLEYAIRSWENGGTARFSSGLQDWNYLYETDAGEMFYRLGMSEVPPATYFVANRESRPLKEYIEILRKTYGAGEKSEFDEPPSIPLPGLNVDMKRTLDTLSYEPKVDFEVGIRTMIERLLHNHANMPVD